MPIRNRSYRTDVKQLATVKTVKSTYAVLMSEKVGDVLVLVSDWLRHKNNNNGYQKKFEDMRSILRVNEIVYFEGYFYKGLSRDGYRAERVQKTTSGIGVVKRLHETYGFLHAPTLNEDIFFPGSSLQDNFCGWKNLERSLRVGDEMKFVAIQDSCDDYAHVRYKAIAVSLPIMGKENDENCVGVVVDSNCYSAKLYCRPLGDVFLPTPSVRLKPGQRLKFTCKTVDSRYEVSSDVAYELLDENYVLKFPKVPTTTTSVVDCVENGGEEIENKINCVLEKNKKGENDDEKNENDDDDNDDDRRSLKINDDEGGSNNNNNTTAEIMDSVVSGGEMAVVDDNLDWSDLEKELVQLTGEVSNFQRLRSSALVDNECCCAKETVEDVTSSIVDLFSPTTTLLDDNIYEQIRSCGKEIFDGVVGDNNFLPPRQQFVVPANNEKDVWTPFSHGSSLDLSHTQTSINEEILLNGKISTTMIAAVASTKDAECQANLCEEMHLLQELMMDEKIFEFVASTRPTCALKWCKLQQKR